ncbi:MAG: A/G-specific adenine glycosylase [Flavobacterium sp.]|uniref:A/G-specific adenine glycosylase n=1 Tax=Flavobacterium sp. TaxID=239 RepID=UPI00121AB57F|nr:A/G-specific adenine glycosylase [Flavobacterium sp.]RZJ66564.1 MAG: A/G-specific adenine glycosylase [Flavobacterium sp.]
MDFAKRLIQWYLQNRRELPWRETTNPYHIWLSEIMLQQTRVAQGMPYYYKFTETFPTVFDLANADEEKVLKLWQGLGYYSRARNLHGTAKIVAHELGGKFPSNYKDLLQLKGVGDYTAAAIASFSYKEAVPVVDGNVFRVLSRYFDIETDIASPKAKKEFAALAFELMPKDDPATFNQAMMEFGALQCVPKNPACMFCPMNDGCLALAKGKVDKLPVKLKKQKITNRYFNYMVYQDAVGNTLLQKREGKGIWQNLYEFPLVETQAAANLAIVSDAIAKNEILSVSEIDQTAITHKLSHQHLFIRFWKVEVSGKLENGISIDDVRGFPVPVVLGNFIDRHFFR